MGGTGGGEGGGDSAVMVSVPVHVDSTHRWRIVNVEMGA